MNLSSARRVLALVGATGLSTWSLMMAPQTAQATISFSAVASADVLHVSFFATDTLVPSLVDAGSPSAQVALDTIGNSTGQAAGIYPGETIASAPGTANGLAPLPAKIPDLPFIAMSRWPGKPTSEQPTGPYLLKATSQAAESTGDVSGETLSQSGVTVGRASAHADARSDGSQVSAIASNDVAAIAGPSITVGAVHSLAKVAYDGTTYARTSEFSVTGLAVAGIALKIGPKGLSLAGQNVPLPDTSPELKILASQGITVRYLAPNITRTSVLTAGLEIDSNVQPPPGAPVSSVKQTLLFGRSFVTVDNASSYGDAPPVPTTTGSSSSGRTTGYVGTPGRGVSGVSTVPGLGAGTSGGDTAPSSADAVGPQMAPDGTQAQQQAATSGILPRGLDLLPPFVIGALALLMISQTARILGVRNP